MRINLRDFLEASGSVCFEAILSEINNTLDKGQSVIFQGQFGDVANEFNTHAEFYQWYEGLYPQN